MLKKAGNQTAQICRCLSLSHSTFYYRIKYRTFIQMKPTKIYQRHRYPSSIISHCVWLNYRFTLSYRDVELVMMQKGISVTYKPIRYWCIKSVKLFDRL